MKKGLIFTVLLMSVITFGFSQTNSWTVTNSSTWIEAVNGVRSGGNDKQYTITVNGTVSIPGSAEATFGAVTGITVNMEGSGTLSLSNNGALLNIGAKQTVIVRDVTLRGRSDNPNSVVDNLGGTFRMEGSASVTGNTRSGGVWVDGGTFIMKDSASVTGNSRSNDNGGGVTVNNGGTFTMQDNASVSRNTVNRYGGGVAINNGTFTMEGGTISNNTSSNYGGGVLVAEYATFTMNNGTISGNTVKAFQSNGDVHARGGGVFVDKYATFTMNGTITRNTCSASSNSTPNAYARGGGVYNEGTFTMNGTISENTVSSSGTFLLSATQALGGGVYIGKGTFTMLDGTISRNTATATANGSANNSRADSQGGGVFVGDGTLNMQGGTIIGNKASSNTESLLYSYSYGGGVYNGSTFNMQGNASVSGNTANTGGGVYNGSTFNMQGNASVSGNTAIGNGGGVYNGRTFTFNMQGGTISGNTATYYGGGVRNNGGTFNKTGGTIYGEDADTNQRNIVVSRMGNVVHNSANSGWRNVTAGPTMNPDTYGFWLNDGDIVTFPSGFAGNWRRNNFNNTLTLTDNTIKSSSSERIWVLQRVSGNSYTFKRADATNTITLNISQNGNNLVISGDSGSGQDNWNGTWNRQR